MSDDKKNVGLSDIFPIIEAKLKDGGTVSFGPKGVSMLPLIKQGVDTVVIAPKSGKLKKYDIPLYRRADGHFILHRVVSVARDGTYTMCGDNQTEREFGVTDDMIIGVLTEIRKPNKTIKVTDLDYINYSKKRVAEQKHKYTVIKIKRKIKKALGV